MARKKRNVEFDPAFEDRVQSIHPRDFLNGNVLQEVWKHRRYLLLLVFIAFFSIANRNHAEKTVIRLNQLEKDVKEMHSKSITISADLVRLSRQSEVVRLVENYGLGLEENLEPNKKLVKPKK
ncbi:MAG: FtsL-like putative cell division protein [Bacteroidales bacterium]